MRVLFVTRKYPPSVGGMETAASELASALGGRCDLKLIASGRSNRWLPVVYPVLFARSLWAGVRHRPDVIYAQDGMLAPLGWVLHLLLGAPSVTTIHGLDVTYPNRVYQALIRPALTHQSAVVAVSEATARRVVAATGGRVSPIVVNNGVRDRWRSHLNYSEALDVIAAKADLTREGLEGVSLLHTNGRLVKRKGVEWFVRYVLPNVIERSATRVVYLVSGSGPAKDEIMKAVAEVGVATQVRLLGRISEELLQAMYTVSDLFIMPNIRVDHDVEGFGLVAVEASSCGTPVVASDLDGVRSAVVPGETGFLVAPEDPRALLEAILRELEGPSLNRSHVRRRTLDHFSWERVSEQYLRVFASVR